MSCTSIDPGLFKFSSLSEFTAGAIEEYIESKFGPDKTKAEILRTLDSCTILHRIPLPPPSVSIEQAQKDFRRERILLNDVAFIPDKDDDERSMAFSRTLKVLLQRLMRNRAVYNSQQYSGADVIADLLMQRACRTSAGSDSFFTIQKMFCVEDTIVTQNTTVTDDPPIHIDVFLSEQANYNRTSRNSTISTVTEEMAMADDVPHLCARMLISNSFALYDNSAMEADFDRESTTDPVPWLDIDSIVVDESDLKTGEHWRKLHLVVTHVESGRIFSSLDDSAVSSSSACSSPLRPPRPAPVLHNIASWLAGYHSSSTSSTSAYPSGQGAPHSQLDDDSSLSCSNLSAALSAATKEEDTLQKES